MQVLSESRLMPKSLRNRNDLIVLVHCPHRIALFLVVLNGTTCQVLRCLFKMVCKHGRNNSFAYPSVCKMKDGDTLLAHGCPVVLS